jgi:hypothetical protein
VAEIRYRPFTEQALGSFDEELVFLQLGEYEVDVAYVL